MKTKLFMTLILCLASSLSAIAQPTEFTYRGRLVVSGSPLTGNYDLQFTPWDALTGGNKFTTETRNNVEVANGYYTVNLNFTHIFPGDDRFMEVMYRPAGTSTWEVVEPRELITSVPYAIKSIDATNAAMLAGIPFTRFVQTDDARLSDARVPLAGSTNYIQNTTALQHNSNFNISGTGKAAFLDAAYHLSINTFRVLSVPGIGNTFVGHQTGVSAPSGIGNTAVGSRAGNANGGGSNNSYFGSAAGVNDTGNSNSFFGAVSGNNAVGGGENSFFGAYTGQSVRSEVGNTFIGSYSGLNNTGGGQNTFIGTRASGAANIGFASAVGAYAYVTRSNSLVLGGISGVNGGFDTNVGIGTTAPIHKLHVVDPTNTGLRVQTNATGGTVASFGGNGTFNVDAPGTVGGRLTIGENGNTGIGTPAPQERLSVGGGLNVDHNNTNNGSVTNTLRFGSSSGEAIGSRRTGGSNQFGLDFYTGFANRMVITNSGNVGIGTASPADRLHVNGTIRFSTLGSAGGAQLCWNGFQQISNCSSSLRYKTNIAPFSSGLSLVNRLHPISFDWKMGGVKDVGFGAEDVARIDPRLVTYNDRGEVEGVKYDRIGVVLINAVKEQQVQIEQQQKQIQQLQSRIDLLMKLVCQSDSAAAICRQ